MNGLNRRYFLMGAAAAAGARAQSAATIGAGVIGVGNRGSADLASVLAQPGSRVAALCDLKPDRLDKAATSAAAHHRIRMARRYRRSAATDGDVP